MLSVFVDGIDINVYSLILLLFLDVCVLLLLLLYYSLFFVRVCEQHRIRISPKKFTLFTKRMTLEGYYMKTGATPKTDEIPSFSDGSARSDHPR